MLRGMLSVFLLGLIACGADLYRPLHIEVEGLSARAEVLVLKLFPPEEQTCGELSQASIKGIDSSYSARWVRSEGQKRELELPQLEAEEVTIAAYSEDANGQPIQFACLQRSLNDIANLSLGVLVIQLTQRSTIGN